MESLEGPKFPPFPNVDRSRKIDFAVPQRKSELKNYEIDRDASRKFSFKRQNPKYHALAVRAVVALAFAVPLGLALAWHVVNQRLPGRDSSSYLVHAWKVFESMDWGNWNAFYFLRGWKPILHPQIGGLLLFIANGDALVMSALFCVGSLGIALVYLYRLARIFCSSLHASLCVLILGITPWLFADALVFNSEILFLSAIVGFVYHLWSARDLRSLGHSIASSAWFGIALCARPAEALVVGLVPLLAFSYSAIHQYRLCAKEVLGGWGLASGVCIGLWLLVGKNNLLGEDARVAVGIALAAASLIPWIMARSWGLNRSFWAFVGIAAALAAIWFSPKMTNLWSWISQCSIGNLARETGGRGQVTRPEFILSTLWKIPGLGFVWIAALAFFFGRARSLNRYLVAPPSVVGVAIITGIFPILLGSFTYNSDLRYYHAGGVLLGLGTLVWSVQCLRERRWLMGVAFAPAILLHFAWVFACFRPKAALPILNALHSPARVYAGESKENLPIRLVWRDISALLPEGKPLDISLVLTRSVPETALSPDSLTVISREHARQWNFHLEYYKRVADAKSYFRQNYDLLIVGPSEKVYPDDRNPHIYRVFPVARQLVSLAESGKLGDRSLRVVGKFQMTQPSVKGSKSKGTYFILSTGRWESKPAPKEGR